MIIVRDVFRLKFGKAKDAKAMMKESKSLMPQEQVQNSRILFDLVGPSYTMVIESSHKNLTEFEAAMGKMPNIEAWQQWYSRFIPLVENSYREIFTVME